MAAGEGKHIKGLLDRGDVAAFVLRMWDKKEKTGEDEQFEEFLQESLKDKTAKDLTNASWVNHLHYIEKNATFRDVLAALSSGGVHSVPVLSSPSGFLRGRTLSRLIAQADVISFVSNNLERFDKLLDIKIGGHVGTYPAICISEATKTIDAFRTMLKLRVSAVGVVTEDNTLVGSISIKEIGYLVTSGKSGKQLAGTVKVFLEATKDLRGRPTKEVVTCNKTTPVRDAITAIHQNSVNSIYVVTPDGKPYGVVTLTDLCRFLFMLESHIQFVGSTAHKKEGFISGRTKKERL
jgi:CBS domain-containing protein